jgi:hypothetical protein
VDCVRHPLAAAYGRHCAACLLEEALATEGNDAGNRTTTAIQPQDPERAQLTILLPLGVSASASIFLVRAHGQPSRLLRLKTWRPPARPDFVARFHELRARLNDWTERRIDPPIAVSIDATGRPSVLTEFRPGIPIVDAVRFGTVSRLDALARLASLAELTRSAHRRGLIHGSIVAGNVIVQPGFPAAWLLDFGLASLLTKRRDDPRAASDIAGLERLAQRVREMSPNPVPQRL